MMNALLVGNVVRLVGEAHYHSVKQQKLCLNGKLITVGYVLYIHSNPFLPLALIKQVKFCELFCFVDKLLNREKWDVRHS